MKIPLAQCLFIDDTEAILIRAQQSGVKYIAMVAQPDMSEPAKTGLSLPSINRLTELFDNIK
jgi:putative hydrolase of the HAD superfamily